MRRNGLTMVELLVAMAIFVVIMGMVLSISMGVFRSLREGGNLLRKGQRERVCVSRLGKEVSSIAKISVSAIPFIGTKEEFFFIYTQDNDLVESRYACDQGSGEMVYYIQSPTDFDAATYQYKGACVQGISECSFSYSDGQNWYDTWNVTVSKLPRMVKYSFKFKDEPAVKDFVFTIPVSQ
ncbi:MAG: prepilin-type N-terminal cleavage/methylation domain-containing protein [Candidatus Omnitrophica bacterium]|nr:prepilin-type N-terminal cleavage/methylation domain-containing protein [Candidatus Omnitrophota bacterium]